jgi:hypothetical protein
MICRSGKYLRNAMESCGLIQGSALRHLDGPYVKRKPRAGALVVHGREREGGNMQCCGHNLRPLQDKSSAARSQRRGVTRNEPVTSFRDQNEPVFVRASAYTRPHGNRGNPRNPAPVAGEWHGRDAYHLFLVRVQVPQQCGSLAGPFWFNSFEPGVLADQVRRDAQQPREGARRPVESGASFEGHQERMESRSSAVPRSSRLAAYRCITRACR